VDWVMTELMRSYVEGVGEEDDPEYDAIVRAKIEAALNDPRPMVPHEEVVRQMDALLDRLEAEQAAAARC
jgi:hypothetical protein